MDTTRTVARPAQGRICSFEGCGRKHYARLRRAAARAGAPIAAPEGARLPKTWEAKTPKPTLPKREFPEIVLAPDDPEAQRRLRIILRRHDADDLTDMLGLTA